jgi:DNA polymerase
MDSSSASRSMALDALRLQARDCTRCGLAGVRRQVVFGTGAADADLMLVAHAPTRAEDEQGVPLVGAAGRLLDELLHGVGLRRADVFVATALGCMPPDNREPAPDELRACQDWLQNKLELVRPTVVAALGGFATKLLREDPTPITQLHGRPEIRRIGPRTVRLLPLVHPAAALYRDEQVEMLRADFAQVPALLALGAPPQDAAPGEREAQGAAAAREPAAAELCAQLGLF